MANRPINRQLTGNQQATNSDRRREEGKKEKETHSSKPEIISLAQAAIDHLNLKTSKKRRVGKAVLADIAKLAEFSALDFRRVIDAKVAEWKSNPDMAKFLRPSTLFRPSKFRAYHDDLEPEPTKPTSRQLTPDEVDAKYGKCNLGFTIDDD